MLPQATGQPGVPCIQEPTHVTTVLSFALNCGTHEDVDAMIFDIFNMGSGGEEDIDGRYPLFGEACLRKKGEYIVKSNWVSRTKFSFSGFRRFHILCLRINLDRVHLVLDHVHLIIGVIRSQ